MPDDSSAADGVIRPVSPSRIVIREGGPEALCRSAAVGVSPPGRATTISLDPACAPDAIEARSFALIDAEVGEDKPFSGRAWEIARRLVHTSGDLSLLDSLFLPEAAIDAGVQALRRGVTVFTDTQMVRAGIALRRLAPFGVQVECLLAQPGVAETAARFGITRSRAGIEAAGTRLGAAVVALGNAPTALLALLEYLDKGGPMPALIIAAPVGFVNAAESKELLMRRCEAPSLIVRGRRGGSPLAAAMVNALACLAAGVSVSPAGAENPARSVP